jgi:hypothetical protein
VTHLSGHGLQIRAIGETKIYMKKGCLYSIGIFTVLAVGFFYILLHAFDPEYDKAEIAQKIGGKLICNSIYNADIHDWQYDVTYEYKSKDNKIFKIGNGSYYAREWNKDEQLQKFDKWIILKTGDFYGSDKVIIGNFVTQKWTDYKFTPEIIENEKMWKSVKIKSLLNYCCAECFITKIDNGKIEVKYKFRINETKTELMDERKLIYEIDKATGKPNLIDLIK